MPQWDGLAVLLNIWMKFFTLGNIFNLCGCNRWCFQVKESKMGQCDALTVLLVKCYCEKELQSEDTIDDLSSKPVQSCQSRTSHRSLPGSRPELWWSWLSGSRVSLGDLLMGVVVVVGYLWAFCQGVGWSRRRKCSWGRATRTSHSASRQTCVIFVIINGIMFVIIIVTIIIIIFDNVKISFSCSGSSSRNSHNIFRGVEP